MLCKCCGKSPALLTKALCEKCLDLWIQLRLRQVNGINEEKKKILLQLSEEEIHKKA
jgi:hypothetical protein